MNRQEYQRPYVFGIIGILMVMIALAVWWQVFKYQDCLKVGHSKAYCILSVGK